MPHVTIKMFAGKAARQKQQIAKDVAAARVENGIAESFRVVVHPRRRAREVGR